MDPIHSWWNSFTFLSRTFPRYISLGIVLWIYPSVFPLAHLSWCVFNLSTTLLPCHSSYRWKDEPSSHLNSYEPENTYSFPQPFFVLFPTVYITFIGQGSYFSKLSLKNVIIPLLLYPWRKWVTTRRIVMVFFSCFRGTLFFFSSWDFVPVRLWFSLGSIGGLRRFTLRDLSHHVS